MSDILSGDIRTLLSVKDELAHSNFFDPHFVNPSREGRAAIQCMQFGLQYFEFTQRVMAEKIRVLQTYVEKGRETLETMEVIDKR